MRIFSKIGFGALGVLGLIFAWSSLAPAVGLKPGSSEIKFMTGGTSQYFNFYTDGGSGQTERFQIAADGSLHINGVTYAWPGSQGGASTVLTNDGSGNLTWGTGGGSITGSGTATRVAFWSSSSALSSNANLYWDDSNSRLGIGTTGPSVSLHVTSSTGPNTLIRTTTSGQGVQPVLTIEAELGTPDTSDGPVLAFKLGGSNHQAAWIQGRERNNFGGELHFYTKTADGIAGNNPTDRMQIDLTGQVGINVTTPAALFDVANKFLVNTNGNITKINNVAYSWPSSQGATQTVLQNDGSGNLTWAANAAANGSQIITDWVSYTPTFTNMGSTSNVDCWYRRVGDSLQGICRFRVGTASAALAQMSLPTSLSMDTTKVSVTRPIGNGWQDSADTEGNVYDVLALPGTSSTNLYFSRVSVAGGQNPLTAQNTSQIMGTTKDIHVQWQIPISGWSSTTTAVNTTGLSANVGTTTLITPSATGFFRFCSYNSITQAATVSSTLPKTQINYTDPDNNTAQTIDVTATQTSDLLTTNSNGCVVFYAKTGVAVTYDTTGYLSVGVTAMNYAIHARLEVF